MSERNLDNEEPDELDGLDGDVNYEFSHSSALQHDLAMRQAQRDAYLACQNFDELQAETPRE